MTLAAGPLMNFVLAIILFSILGLVQGTPDASKPGAVIKGLVAGAPAEQAGLRVDDRIVAADGQPIASMTDLQTYTAAHLGQPVRYTVVRPGRAAIRRSSSRSPHEQIRRRMRARLVSRSARPCGPTKIWEAGWIGREIGREHHLHDVRDSGEPDSRGQADRRRGVHGAGRNCCDDRAVRALRDLAVHRSSRSCTSSP